MLLRHLTTKDCWQEIKECGYLKGSDHSTIGTKEKQDDYISFEEFNPIFDENIFVDIYVKLWNAEYPKNKIKKSDVVQLIFDGNQMKENGIIASKNFGNEDGYTKEECLILNNDKETLVTRERFDQIGNYAFVKGDLSLKYLKEKVKYFKEDVTVTK